MYKTLNNFVIRNFYLVTFTIVTLLFHVCYGLEVLNPTNINWLMSAYHDWGQHYLGWAYFKAEPWHFPIGHIENFNYPIGSNVGFTDSIPLLAIFFKLFSFLLPETFQYLGIWLFSCHILTAFFSIKILRLYRINGVLIIIATILIAFNPVLIYRGLHPALCGHWLILASLYNFLLVSTEQNVAKITRNQTILMLTSALVNPYILLIVFSFNAILLVKHLFVEKSIKIKQGLFFLIVDFTALVAVWLLVGLLSLDNRVKIEVANSYGLYSSNLNTFFNGQGFSKLLPMYPLKQVQQYEGFGYLGVGLMVVVVFAAVLFLTKNEFKSLSTRTKLNGGLLLSITLFFTLFSVSNIITFNDKILGTYWCPSLLTQLGGIFRACGRFIWLGYYLIVVLSLLVFLKSRISLTVKTMILFFVLLVQGYDCQLLLTFRELPTGDYKVAKLQEDKWLGILSPFKEIITYPPFNNNLVNHLDYQDLCFLALKKKLPITTGYVARETGELNQKFLDSLNSDISELKFKDESIFVIQPKNLEIFLPMVHSGLIKLTYLDGYFLAFSSKVKLPEKSFADEVSKQKLDSVQNIITASSKMVTTTYPAIDQGKMELNVEKFQFTKDIVTINGWAFLKKSTDISQDSIFIALADGSKCHIVKTKRNLRNDVTNHFKAGNLDNCGFSASIFTDKLPNTIYEVLIGIKRNGSVTFQKIPSIESVDLRMRNPPETVSVIPAPNKEIIYNIDNVSENRDYINITGWAALQNLNSTNSETTIFLLSTTICYKLNVVKSQRKDVTEFFGGKINYDASGFSVRLSKSDLKKGQYKVAIYVKDKNKDGFIRTESSISVK